MTRLAAIVALLVLAVTATGCVAIDRPPRVAPETVARIEPGLSTREDVLFALGLPKATGQGGAIFFYESERSANAGFLFSPAPLFPAVFLPVGVSTLENLRIDFDADGIVRNVAAGERTLSFPFGLLREDEYALATPEEDEEAKRFRPDPDACMVYLFVEREGGVLSSQNQPPFEIDGRLAGSVGAGDRYYRVRLAPGEHSVSVLRAVSFGGPALWEPVRRIKDPLYSLYADKRTQRTKIPRNQLAFTCAAGELVFIEMRFGALAKVPKLKQVDTEMGRTAVLERGLMILLL